VAATFVRSVVRELEELDELDELEDEIEDEPVAAFRLPAEEHDAVTITDATQAAHARNRRVRAVPRLISAT
jgi:hypothetical protein